MHDNTIAITMLALAKNPGRTVELMAKLTGGKLDERELAEVSAELYLLGEGATPEEFAQVLQSEENDEGMRQVNAYSLDWLRRTHPEVFDNEG